MEELPDTAVVDQRIKDRLDEILAARLDETLTRLKEERTPSIAIIATGGTLDSGYLPFILSATAAALGWNASVFFTFYGLQLLKKDISDLRMARLGNPAMPFTLPFGPQWFRNINWEIPNVIRAITPGFEALLTSLIKRKFRDNGVANLTELRDLCIDSGVHLVACQMTIEMLGFRRDDFIPEVTEYAGAATFLPMAKEADVSLFM
jgi:peroxiredoxin family protein